MFTLILSFIVLIAGLTATYGFVMHGEAAADIAVYPFSLLIGCLLGTVLAILVIVKRFTKDKEV